MHEKSILTCVVRDCVGGGGGAPFDFGLFLGLKNNNLLIHVMHRYCAIFMTTSFATTVKPLSGEVKHYLITVQ